jgi:CRISPR-associated protein Cas2
VNLQQVRGKGFEKTETGAILMDDATCKEVLVAYQKRKQEEIHHPFLGEQVEVELLPFVQAMLLARHLRGTWMAIPPSLGNEGTMLVLVTYDVNTETPESRRRLCHVAKMCMNRGQRVQRSVFESLMDPAQWAGLRQSLIDEINPKEDSLYFCFLGKNWRDRVEHVGAKPAYNPEGPLIPLTWFPRTRSPHNFPGGFADCVKSCWLH